MYFSGYALTYGCFFMLLTVDLYYISLHRRPDSTKCQSAKPVSSQVASSGRQCRQLGAVDGVEIAGPKTETAVPT
jgi:hypothetical protein